MNYHWIMTVQNGLRMDTVSGDVDLDPGTSRSEVYDSIRDRVFAEARVGKAAVLFFSLEPDVLSAVPDKVTATGTTEEER